MHTVWSTKGSSKTHTLEVGCTWEKTSSDLKHAIKVF